MTPDWVGGRLEHNKDFGFHKRVELKSARAARVCRDERENPGESSVLKSTEENALKKVVQSL